MLHLMSEGPGNCFYSKVHKMRFFTALQRKLCLHWRFDGVADQYSEITFSYFEQLTLHIFFFHFCKQE